MRAVGGEAVYGAVVAEHASVEGCGGILVGSDGCGGREVEVVEEEEEYEDDHAVVGGADWVARMEMVGSLSFLRVYRLTLTLCDGVWRLLIGRSVMVGGEAQTSAGFRSAADGGKWNTP